MLEHVMDDFGLGHVCRIEGSGEQHMQSYLHVVFMVIQLWACHFINREQGALSHQVARIILYPHVRM